MGRGKNANPASAVPGAMRPSAGCFPPQVFPHSRRAGRKPVRHLRTRACPKGVAMAECAAWRFGLPSPALCLIGTRSEEHTSELQSPCNLVCRLLLEKNNISVSPGLLTSFLCDLCACGNGDITY